MKEKVKSVPKELVRCGLDDGTERLRGQLRDTAQRGQTDDYGGDRIEDTAVGGARRVKRGIENLLKKKKAGKRDTPQDRAPSQEPPAPEPGPEGSPPSPQTDPAPTTPRATDRPRIKTREAVAAREGSASPSGGGRTEPASAAGAERQKIKIRESTVRGDHKNTSPVSRDGAELPRRDTAAGSFPDHTSSIRGQKPPNRLTIKARDAHIQGQPVPTLEQPPQALMQGRQEFMREGGWTIIKTASSGKKTAERTAKQTIKTAERSSQKAVKTAQQTAKTARRTVKTAQKSAQATAKAAPQAVQTARAAAKTAATARTVAKATLAAIKASITATQELIAAIAAAGLPVLLAVVVICLAGLLAVSPFGIFFADGSSPDTVSPSTAAVQLNNELSNHLSALQAGGSYDRVEIIGQPPDWSDMFAVFSAKTAGVANGMDVVTLDTARVDLLRSVFWDMTKVTAAEETIDHPASGSTPAWSETVLNITITARTPDDMRVFYSFTDAQNRALDGLLANSGMLGTLASDLTITSQDARALLSALPNDLSPERRAVVEAACRLVGKVNYFWGGKSRVLGWDDRWGQIKKVTAAGSSTSGTYLPFGLDCSGFVDWVFYNVSGGSYIIGHGGGARSQHTYCTAITWDQAIPGDLVFYPGDSHVGIVGGRDESGNLLIIHCTYSKNNVVITGKSGFTAIARPNYYSE